MISEQERKDLFPTFRTYANGFGTEGTYDLEMKDPDSVLSKAMNAFIELQGALTPKYIEAMELTQTNTWDKYENSDCLLKGLLMNDVMFDPGDDEKYGLKDKVDIMIGFANAAYDTTATSLTNLIYAIHKQPKHAENVRNAIMAHPELSKQETIFTMDMINSCEELVHFNEEIQRVYGFVPFMVRLVHDENGLEFGDYNIPRDVAICVPFKWLHMGEGSWTDGMEFNPSRFNKTV